MRCLPSELRDFSGIFDKERPGSRIWAHDPLRSVPSLSSSRPLSSLPSPSLSRPASRVSGPVSQHGMLDPPYRSSRPASQHGMPFGVCPPPSVGSSPSGRLLLSTPLPRDWSMAMEEAPPSRYETLLSRPASLPPVQALGPLLDPRDGSGMQALARPADAPPTPPPPPPDARSDTTDDDDHLEGDPAACDTPPVSPREAALCAAREKAFWAKEALRKAEETSKAEDDAADAKLARQARLLRQRAATREVNKKLKQLLPGEMYGAIDQGGAAWPKRPPRSRAPASRLLST